MIVHTHWEPQNLIFTQNQPFIATNYSSLGVMCPKLFVPVRLSESYWRLFGLKHLAHLSYDSETVPRYWGDQLYQQIPAFHGKTTKFLVSPSSPTILPTHQACDILNRIDAIHQVSLGNYFHVAYLVKQEQGASLHLVLKTNFSLKTILNTEESPILTKRTFYITAFTSKKPILPEEIHSSSGFRDFLDWVNKIVVYAKFPPRYYHGDPTQRDHCYPALNRFSWFYIDPNMPGHMKIHSYSGKYFALHTKYDATQNGSLLTLDALKEHYRREFVIRR